MTLTEDKIIIQAQQTLKLLAEGKNITQIADTLGVTRGVLYRLRNTPAWNQLASARIGEIDHKLETWIQTLWDSQNPLKQRAALTAAIQLRKQITDKALPTRTENLTINLDLQQRQRTTQTWKTLLREAPPHIRTYITQKYTEIQNRPTP